MTNTQELEKNNVCVNDKNQGTCNIQKQNRPEEKKNCGCNRNVTRSPRVDIYENDEAVILEADLPGVSKENVNITLEQNELKINGHVNKLPENWKLIHREGSHIDFERVFRITKDIDCDGITAEMNAGVLKVRLAKVKKVLPKRIQVA